MTKRNLRKVFLVSFIIYTVFAVSFYFLSGDQLKFRTVEDSIAIIEADSVTPEITRGVTVTQEFTKVVQESSQNVANNMFAGVLGAMAQQMNMGVMPMNLGQVQQVAMAGCANHSVISNEAPEPVTERNLQDNELVSDNSMLMDNDTRSKLGSLFDMGDD